MKHTTAIIDIGSNSVRLVIYEQPSRHLVMLHNEKTFSALGKNVVIEGSLSQESMDQTFQHMKRFMVMCEAFHVKSLTILATAAVREASNSKAFIQAIEKITKTKALLLSGHEEACYAAQGVRIAFIEAQGVVGDLGGGSLELTTLYPHHEQDHRSLPLGALCVNGKGNRQEQLDYIDQHLAHFHWPKSIQNFYCIGGGWRTLGTLFMDHTHYPLPLIHGYETPASAMVDFLDQLSRLPSKQIALRFKLADKRKDTLGSAALVLWRIIHTYAPTNLIFSTYGIREGYYFSKLSAADKKDDPFLVYAHHQNGRFSRDPSFCDALYSWVHPLFPKATAQQKRLQKGLCLVSDIGWADHPDYRGEGALQRFLHAPYAGLCHSSRSLFALAAYARYNGIPKKRTLKVVPLVQEDEDFKVLMATSLAIRLAYVMAGISVKLLKETSLQVNHDQLDLTVCRSVEEFGGDDVWARLKQLCDFLGQKASIIRRLP